MKNTNTTGSKTVECPFCGVGEAFPLLLKSGKRIDVCESCYEDGAFKDQEAK